MTLLKQGANRRSRDQWCFVSSRNTQDGEEEEDDYIDSEDEREEGEKAPHENAFVFIDESGKLVYINPEEDEGEDVAGLEEKKEVGNRVTCCGCTRT